jgi:hypothetical protein
MAVRRILSDRTEQICCVVIGLGIVVWSFLEAADRNTFAATAVIGGVVLIAAGLLIESIAEFSISARGATFKTREPDRSRATEVAAQGPTAGMEPDSDDPLELARYLAADAALEQLLRAKIDRSALEGCELHLFLWDARLASSSRRLNRGFRTCPPMPGYRGAAQRGRPIKNVDWSSSPRPRPPTTHTVCLPNSSLAIND